MSIDQWGSEEWNENKFSGDLDGDGDLWGMRWRGMDRNRHAIYLRLLKPVATAGGVKKMLDIGCALCDFTRKLADLNPANAIYAVDISPTAVEWCRKHFPSIQFEKGSIPDIAFDTQFDVITCLQVLCYLPDDQRRQTIVNIHSRLNDDGYMLFSGCLDDKATHHSEAEIRDYLDGLFVIEEMVFHHWYEYRKVLENPLDKIRDRLMLLSETMQLPDAEFADWLAQKAGIKKTIFSLLRACRFIVDPLLLRLPAALIKLIIGSPLIVAVFDRLMKLRGSEKAAEIIVLARKA